MSQTHALRLRLVMRQAHAMARAGGWGSYRERLAKGLREAWKAVKAEPEATRHTLLVSLQGLLTGLVHRAIKSVFTFLSPKAKPMPAKISHYLIIDNHTKAIVGKAKTRQSATTAVDRRDNAYGGYRFQARAVWIEEGEGEGRG